MSRMVLAAIVAALGVSGGAGVFAADASAAKESKPAHVVADLDYVYVNNCFPTPGLYGHIAINAFDDDLTPVVNSWDRQNDRISIEVTWADGTTWSQDPIGMEIRDDGTVFIASTSWYTGWTLHDGGSPGTALSGNDFNGVPETLDWLHYQSVTGCSSGRFFLTSGNINING